ncbi:phytoene/squalene synthase family protein [Sorangium sp. So ce1036]|uniref:phytoene/squalene synthase family protein n=1 Tax=Sorangium sp. So ce1036 TaxID=3133328 RepID=UPI003F00C40B
MPRRSADTQAADAAACRALLRKGSKSFAVAALLLPSRVREPAAAFYAFCRVADDAVDELGDHAPPSAAAAAVAGLRERLARACAGRPDDSPVDRALARVVAEHALPRAFLEALLDGFAWDAEGRRYETLSELNAYAARVAGTVGATMSTLMGARGPDALARACDLGVAMQLTNVARDVGEDARRGRIYLPLAWMREAGIEPDAWLARPAFDARLGQIVARLLAEAEALYRRADAGIPMLPRDCRAAIHAARLIYADIGRAVARRGFDSVSGRAAVSPGRKLWLVLGALLRASAAPADDRERGAAPPLDETRFLVEAAR